MNTFETLVKTILHVATHYREVYSDDVASERTLAPLREMGDVYWDDTKQSYCFTAALGEIYNYDRNGGSVTTMRRTSEPPATNELQKKIGGRWTI